MHFGITGEDLVREMIPPGRPQGGADRRPLVWSRQRRSPCRRPGSTCATWPTSMTSPPRIVTSATAACGSRPNTSISRATSSPRGVADYRIVEAPVPPRAPAAGTAGADRRYHLDRRDACGERLKIIEDGTILRSQANLVASRGADWSDDVRAIARVMLDRIAAHLRARAIGKCARAFKAVTRTFLPQRGNSSASPPRSAGRPRRGC